MVPIIMLSLYFGLALTAVLVNLKESEHTEKVLFLDLDDTLFKAKTGLREELVKAIASYVAEKTPHLNAKQELATLYKEYHLTMRGLVHKHKVNCNDYEEFLDQKINYQLIGPDVELQALLSRVKAKIVVFTNCPARHTIRTLQILGVYDQIDYILHPDHYGDHVFVKPMPEAFRYAQELINTLPSNIYFVDDGLKNIEAARAEGWNAARLVELMDGVISDDQQPPIINELSELEIIFPELFQ